VKLVDVQTISVAVAATSVVAFVVNSILTSRREEKRSQQNLETRQAQMFMSIYQNVTSMTF
jgi:mannitol-specific phosphotransferase system IIBC component